MKVLATAGNTLVPIDQVRCITNVFTGRTGARIALCGHERGHQVTLLTSHPAVVSTLRAGAIPPGERWSMVAYRTFDDLQTAMAGAIRQSHFDVVIQSAAVSDYLAAGVFAPDAATHFEPQAGRWQGPQPAGPRLLDMGAAKVKSDVPELWLRLVRAPKLIDLVRTDWGFRGILVKFKLEAGVNEEVLLEIAERSRLHSHADLMVANTLEGAGSWACIGPVAGAYHRVSRKELPGRLFEAIERLHAEHHHG